MKIDSFLSTMGKMCSFNSHFHTFNCSKTAKVFPLLSVLQEHSHRSWRIGSLSTQECEFDWNWPHLKEDILEFELEWQEKNIYWIDHFQISMKYWVTDYVIKKKRNKIYHHSFSLCIINTHAATLTSFATWKCYKHDMKI